MSNFREDVEKVVGDEPVEAVVIGGHGDSYAWGEDPDDVDGYLKEGEPRFIPKAQRGRVLTWEEARPLLDYEYDPGFGGVDCHAIWLWTPTRVLFIHEYDGATGIHQVPRHPQDGNPECA